MSQPVHVVWDCRVKSKKPLEIWKQILEKTGGNRPTSLLVLQPPNTDLPQPLCTIMRMCLSKMFVGEDALQFCYVELCCLLSNQPNSAFVIVSDDVPHFARAFRVAQPASAIFFTQQKLQWPLSEASWAAPLQFIAPGRSK
ncbi:hypothetical protein TVAG_464090 [Trichomonas vaginalis G3]|uniref:NYN domain-containing protein n=1 Tax=Trichomonas vaginalis (strain ATCC PRA-98 / G3) TaxID=412133 RepID=A2E261_TRIV3|nr:hypothetical protein TVAGG3_1048760 [Trichomonas vaginalis G3]EAY13275.1 hypothetical protein TVAG_464090 [Trichomonas vaginalis G3]KAI5494069.1 hypothetical protein TVAGG3_1048760 [Trichomonas vaginalis G3]|eukprot:XP_001325498.1 hypothetical protein [Trichomonas vaginalis G3]